MECLPVMSGYAALPPASADERLFRELVATHTDRLRRFIVKHIGNDGEAEDLTQQAFLEAARSFGTFRGDSQLSTWLYGIALNLVRNHLSRAPERRFEFVAVGVLEQVACEGACPRTIIEHRQALEILAQALEELPAAKRDILLLMSLDDISYEEAARQLTLPVGTVRSRLSRARQALRLKLLTKGLPPQG